MISANLTRRNFATRLAPVFSAFGLATLLSKPSAAKASKHEDMGVKKLNEEGKPNEGTSFIMPIVIHNGVAYIAGQGAHDTGPAESWEIGAHTTKVMDKIKKLVEAAGSTMDVLNNDGTPRQQKFVDSTGAEVLVNVQQTIPVRIVPIHEDQDVRHPHGAHLPVQ